MGWWNSRTHERNRHTYRHAVFARDGEVIILGDRAIASAESYNVVPAIHFDDLVFATIFVTYSDRVLEHAAETYYMSGRVSAERIRNIAAMYLVDPMTSGVFGRSLRVLDFASGYGCTSRHIKNVMPAADLHAIDIHDAACKFHRGRLGISASLSTLEPERLDAAPDYDIVFALSFFSHLPKHLFSRWLIKLGQFVKPNGILIFTTNGMETHHTLIPHMKIGRDGFGSIRDSEQFDIPLDYYMHVVTYPKFVHGVLDRIRDFELRMFFQSIWWLHQDAYVLRRR